ncbi:MAG: flagellar hook-associated protein FlgK [Gammaproteobacteria bacterium]|nr:flagellar hook-associated protein FlgK [Gammaproteobacteria bacterium]
MAGLLNTAVSGLQVSQTALKTTGHNIANANTPGYSRQSVELATNAPSFTGAGFIGNGVTITAVERVVDEFLITQLRADSSLNSELQTFSSNIGQLDTLLSDSSTGLSAGLDRFFSMLENGADDPASIPSRQLIVSEAENLAQRFNTLYERISTIGENVDSKMNVAVSQINSLASNIATLNNKISQTTSSLAPNDLLDQREEALRQLSELVAIDVVDQGDGLVNVSVGSGQSLVIGSTARQMAIVDGELDPQLREVAFSDGARSQVITAFINGGELGGLLDFRDSILSTSLNELGRVAMVLSDSVNQVHRLGIDLNNQFGGDFFRSVNDAALSTTRVFNDDGNTPPDDRVLSLELVDSSILTASDYTLEAGAGDTSYRITRHSDGAVVARGSLPANPPASVEFDGLKLNFAQGSFQPGDKFLLQPTRTAARDMTAVIERPDQLAFASPLVTGSDSGNTGNATISAGSVLSLDTVDGDPIGLFSNQQDMQPPLLVRFTTATTYEVLDNSDPGKPVALDPPIRNRVYVPGQQNPLFSGDPGETLVTAAGSALGIGSVVTGAGPLAPVANGYPSEILSFLHTDPDTGNTTRQVLNPALNSSAKTLAAQLADVNGVSAFARNSMVLSGVAGLNNSSPLQINLNGVDLIEYDAGLVSSKVPDPAADAAAFNRYLANRINQDSGFVNLGIYAVAATNATSGQVELQVFSTQGDDFNLSLEASGGDSLVVSDYNASARTLTGAGAGNQAAVTVGGTLDVVLAANVQLASNPTVSGLLGDSSAAGFAQSTYLGISASINGVAERGDQFTLDFNLDGVSDNRNAMALSNLSTANLVDSGQRSLGDAYGTLVEVIGIETNTAKLNGAASAQVLAQTEDLRNSISGVSLDEEASNLILFEQIYNANAQVISVARDLFDRLINIF